MESPKAPEGPEGQLWGSSHGSSHLLVVLRMLAPATTKYDVASGKWARVSLGLPAYSTFQTGVDCAIGLLGFPVVSQSTGLAA